MFSNVCVNLPCQVYIYARKTVFNECTSKSASRKKEKKYSALYLLSKFISSVRLVFTFVKMSIVFAQGSKKDHFYCWTSLFSLTYYTRWQSEMEKQEKDTFDFWKKKEGKIHKGTGLFGGRVIA
jgi:hypothetical protein